MGRVRLELPECFPFKTDIPIRISDINYGGHLGHDALLPVCHEARVRFLAEFGYTESDIEGLTYLMADAAIIYKAEAFYGQVMEVRVAVRDFSRSGCDFVYLLTERETGIEIARVKTGMVFYDIRAGGVARVPERFRARFDATQRPQGG